MSSSDHIAATGLHSNTAESMACAYRMRSNRSEYVVQQALPLVDLAQMSIREGQAIARAKAKLRGKWPGPSGKQQN